MFCVLFSLILFPLFSADYVLYEVTAFNPHEREILYYLHIKKKMITFMNSVSNEAAIPMDVIVERDAAAMFEIKLKSFDIQYIFVTEITMQQLKGIQAKTYDINISNEFYDWESIQYWVDNNKKNNVDFNKIVIGKTFENRDIFILKISTDPKKPIVFIVGGEDGRDWLSSAIILNLLSELLDGSSELNNLLNIYDFYLLPLLNPDGFVYSKDKNRLWAKNRQVDQQTTCNGSFAVGVNIARNWFTQKSSKVVDKECQSIYLGHKGLSEEETQILSYVLNSVSLNMLAFINIRGFGRYVTVPYAKSMEKANNHDIVMEIIKSACSKVFKQHNATFYYDTTEKFFYNFSGNMADWVKSKLNTPVVFTVYLEDVNTVFPMNKHILPLSKEFYTILYDSLTISKQMYGPLFNGQLSDYYFHIEIKELTNIYILKIILCILYFLFII